jgi:hypothetical protein
VSIRYRLAGDPEHPFSEAIGIVMAVKPDETGRAAATIVKRDGDRTSVALDDVVAGKAWVVQG